MDDSLVGRARSLTTAALELAGRGWPVFPLRPRRKEPAVRDWERRATADPDVIRRTWEVAPWNVGVACGRAGLVVVDLDTGPGGDHGRRRLAQLAAEAGTVIPADTFTVRTPGGEHLYFGVSTDAYRNTAGRLGPKIDTRATGGYVVGAGSVVGGKRYRVVADLEPAPLPVWIADRLRAPAPRVLGPAPGRGVASNYIEAAIKGETRRVEEATAGTRNHSLFVAAARLGRFVQSGGLADQEVWDVLLRAVERHRGSGGLTDREIHRTIQSGLSRYAPPTSTVTARPLRREGRTRWT